MPIKKQAVRILIPILIVAAIAGVWFLKSQEAPVSDPHNAIPLHITAVDMDKITAHGLPIMIDFGYEACPPCKAMAPTLVKLNDELQDKAVIHSIDIQLHPEVNQNYPVRVTPSQVFYNPDGTPYIPSQAIMDILPRLQMYTYQDNDQHVLTMHEGLLTEQQIRSIFADMGVDA